MPDHATEAREWLGDYPLNARSRDQMHDRLAIAQAHALLAIHDQLAAIARRLPEPVANDLLAEAQPPAHPGGYVPDCGIDHESLRASLAQTAARVTKAAAQGEANLAALRAALGHPSSPDDGKEES